MKVLDFFRNRIPFLSILLFFAAAWCFAEWKYPIASLCSSLLIRMDEPPEFTRASIEKKDKRSPYDPKETLTGLRAAQRKAGRLNVNSQWDGSIPLTEEVPSENCFIADTCLRNWAAVPIRLDGSATDVKAALARQPECGDAAVTCTGESVFSSGKWRNVFFTSLKGELDMNKAFPGRKENEISGAYLLAGLHASQAYPNAKILIAYDGMLKLFLNGEQVFQSKNKSVRRDDYFPVDVQLREGVNTLLVKSVCSDRQWSLRIRVTDYRDEPIFFVGEASF